MLDWFRLDNMEGVDSICVEEWKEEDDESDEVVKEDTDVVDEDMQVLVEVHEGKQVGKSLWIKKFLNFL